MAQGEDLEREPRISVVIAVQRAQANLPAILSALERVGASDIEALICHAGDDPVDRTALARPYVRFVEGNADALIPELWSDGILAANGRTIAILTAHCVPQDDWIAQALNLDMDKRAGYGGVITLESDADAVCAAIHLLRYSAVTPPQEARELHEIAADNAVYRREDILACDDLLPEGFWEPSFHARFRAKGDTLAMAPALVVAHLNLYSPGAFMKQRLRHGRNFGRTRGVAAALPKRLAMFVLSPLGFVVFGAKLTGGVMKSPALKRHYWRSLPWLATFLASWSLGEALGYWDSLFAHSGATRETGVAYQDDQRTGSRQ